MANVPPTLSELREEIRRTSPIPIVKSAVARTTDDYFARQMLFFDSNLARLLAAESQADGDVGVFDNSAVVGVLAPTVAQLSGNRRKLVLLTTTVTYILLPAGVAKGTEITLLATDGFVPVGGANGVAINGVAGNGVTTPANPSTVTPDGTTYGGVTLVSDGTNWFTTATLNFA